jgi:hypothetical protein
LRAAGASRALFGIELIHQIDDAVEACPLTLEDRVPSQGGRQMRFAGPGSANMNDIAGGGEIVSGSAADSSRPVGDNRDRLVLGRPAIEGNAAQRRASPKGARLVWI